MADFERVGEKGIAIIDNALTNVSGREVVSTAEVMDYFLDLRFLFASALNDNQTD